MSGPEYKITDFSSATDMSGTGPYNIDDIPIDSTLIELYVLNVTSNYDTAKAVVNVANITTSGQTIVDSDFLNLKNYQQLSLTGTNSVSLGVNAANAGIFIVQGGDGGTTFTVATDYPIVIPYNASLPALITDSKYSLPPYIYVAGSANWGTVTQSLLQLLGGSANDTFQFSTPAQIQNTTIKGDDGNDAISILSESQTIDDTVFALVSGVEALSLAGGTNSITLGETSNTIGLTTFYSGTDSNTFTVTSAYTLKPTFSGGSGNTYQFASATQLGNATITATASGSTNTIQLTSLDTETINDSAFAKISNVSVLVVNSGQYTVTLGAKASAAGISNISGTIATDTTGNYSNTFDVSSTEYKLAPTLVGGSGVNLFKLRNSLQLASAYIAGQEGQQNSITLTHADTVTDADLSHVTWVSSLTVSNGGSKFTLAGFANRAGLVTVTGGAGANVFDASSSLYTLSPTLVGGADNDSFILASATQLSGSTITGDGGDANVLTLTNASQTVTDGNFEGVTGIQKLVLSSGVNSVTLSNYASTAGIRTLDGTSGQNTFDVSSDDYTLNPILLGGSSDDIFILSGSSQLGSAEISGRKGANSITLSQSAQTVADTSFKKIFDVQSFTTGDGDNTVTLAEHAAIAGINRVTGGNGSNIFDISSKAYEFLKTTLVGGTGQNLFELSTSSQLALTTIVGGGGNDVVQLMQDSQTVLDRDLAHVSGVAQLTTANGVNSVTLGAFAKSSQLDTIIGGSGSNSFDVSASAYGLAATLTGGASNDKFTLSGVSQLALSVINGNGGTDTLEFSQSSQTVSDDELSGLSGIESLITGNGVNSVILGENAQKAGVTTLTGGSGTNTFDVSSSDYELTATLNGAGSANMFILSDVDQLHTTIINGGTGNDTIQLIATTNLSIVDEDFANDKSIETLQIAGSSNNSITLGEKANSTGINTLIATSNGVNVFNVASSKYTLSPTLIGSLTGTNQFQLSTAARLAATTIQGAGANDTIQLSAQLQRVTDTDLANVSGVGKLVMADGENSVTLGANARRAGLINVTGGAGPTVFNVSSSYYGLSPNLTGGGANDLFVFSGASQLGLSTVTGGGGTDTVEFSLGGQTVIDKNFSGLAGVQTLRTANGVNSVTLAGEAQEAGITTLTGGTGANTFNVSSSDYTLIPTLNGGSSADLFILSDAAQLASATINGGLGNDTIQLIATTDITVIDTDFSNDTSVETLTIAGADNSVTLGAVASSAGIRTLVATSNGTNIFNLDSSYSLAPILNGSVTGTNQFQLASAGQLALATIKGAGSNDTIQLFSTGQTTIADANLARVSGVGKLVLANVANTVTLGANARSAGLTNITGGSGPNTFDVSANTYGLSATLVGGADNDLFILSGAPQLGSSSVTGGGGADAVQLSFASQTVADSAFARVTGIQTLRTANGVNSVTLAANAQKAGVTTVTGGTGANTFNVSSGDYTLIPTLNGGSSSDLFILSDEDQLASATINGGLGIDTIQLTATTNISIIDTDFSNDTSVETLKIAGSNNSVTLGAAANSAGIITLVATSSGATVFNIDSSYKLAPILNGSMTGTNQFQFASAGQLALATIKGAGSKDTIQLFSTDPTTIADANLARVAGVGNLVMANVANTVTLGANARNAGIRNITGGSASNSFDVSSSSYGLAATLTGGSSDDLFIFSGAPQLGSSTVNGGGGNDAIKIALASQTVADSAFARLTGVQTLTTANGANKITLAANAQKAGVTTLNGGSGSNTFDVSSGSYTLTPTLNGGIGTDLFILSNQTQLANAIINGGDSNDTVQLTTTNISITDADFANVRSVETLVFAANSSVSLGLNASAAGITALTAASSGANTFDISSSGYGLSATLTASGGTNLFRLSDGAQLARTTIRNSSGQNTIQLVNADQTITDENLSKVIGPVQNLKLSNGNNRVTLGAYARSCQMSNITGGDGTDIFDISSSSYGMTPTITGGNGNDLFLISGVSQLNGSTLSGGGGSDIIKLAMNGQNISDSVLSRISGVETLELANGANYLTLGTKASTAGISTIYGGANNDVINLASSSYTLNATVKGDRGSDRISFNKTTDNVVIIRNGYDSTVNAADRTITNDIISNLIAENIQFAVQGYQSGGTIGYRSIVSAQNDSILNINKKITDAATLSFGQGNDYALITATGKGSTSYTSAAGGPIAGWIAIDANQNGTWSAGDIMITLTGTITGTVTTSNFIS